MALTTIERRTIANLSIPRNVDDLMLQLRTDPFSGIGSTSGFELSMLLDDLKKKGWVTSMGDEDGNPGKVAAAVDSHKHARSMPDEKAQNYEARLKVPHRSWRRRGPLWVFTDEGFDALHDPDGVGDPTPLPTHVVEQMIQQEFDRILSVDPKKITTHRLGERLLEEEFTAWAKSVCDGHEELTGERPLPPIAGGAGYADATELLILDPENGKGSAYTETAPWFMAAVTVAITDADTGSTITEAGYTGYARKSVAAADMGTAAAGASSNVNAITFAACTALTAAVIGFGKCVAATVGRLIKYGTCAQVNVSSTQQPLNFAIGAFTTSLD